MSSFLILLWDEFENIDWSFVCPEDNLHNLRQILSSSQRPAFCLKYCLLFRHLYLLGLPLYAKLALSVTWVQLSSFFTRFANEHNFNEMQLGICQKFICENQLNCGEKIILFVLKNHQDSVIPAETWVPVIVLLLSTHISIILSIKFHE